MKKLHFLFFTIILLVLFYTEKFWWNTGPIGEKLSHTFLTRGSFFGVTPKFKKNVQTTVVSTRTEALPLP